MLASLRGHERLLYRKTVNEAMKMFEEYRRVMYHQTEETFGIGATSMHSILKFHLHVKKDFFLWISYSLAKDQKFRYIKVIESVRNLRSFLIMDYYFFHHNNVSAYLEKACTNYLITVRQTARALYLQSSLMRGKCFKKRF